MRHKVTFPSQFPVKSVLKGTSRYSIGDIHVKSEKEKAGILATNIYLYSERHSNLLVFIVGLHLSITS